MEATTRGALHDSTLDPLKEGDQYASRLATSPILQGSEIFISTRSRPFWTRRQVVDGEKADHKCPLCGVAFARKFNLKTHIQTHFPERPRVKCRECDRSFYRHGDLARHQRTHVVGHKQHVCELCGKDFARLDRLRLHIEGGKCPKAARIVHAVQLASPLPTNRQEGEFNATNTTAEGYHWTTSSKSERSKPVRSLQPSVSLAEEEVAQSLAALSGTRRPPLPALGETSTSIAQETSRLESANAGSWWKVEMDGRQDGFGDGFAAAAAAEGDYERSYLSDQSWQPTPCAPVAEWPWGFCPQTPIWNPWCGCWEGMRCNGPFANGPMLQRPRVGSERPETVMPAMDAYWRGQ